MQDLVDIRSKTVMKNECKIAMPSRFVASFQRQTQLVSFVTDLSNDAISCPDLRATQCAFFFENDASNCPRYFSKYFERIREDLRDISRPYLPS